MKSEQLHLKLDPELMKKIAAQHEQYCKEQRLDISINQFCIKLINTALEP